MSKIKQAMNKQELEAIVAEGKPVLVDFFATWCGPCQMLGVMLDEFAGSYKNIDKINIVKIDIDQAGDLASEYKVSAVPTLFFVNNSKIVDSSGGMRTMEEIESKLDAMIK